MPYLDKINIYVPKEIQSAINNDCENFHFEKNNKGEYKKNEFLTRLVLGYNQEYKDKQNDQRDYVVAKLKNTLKKYKISDEQIKKMAEDFLKEVNKTKDVKRTKEAAVQLSYKIVKLTKNIFYQIDDNGSISKDYIPEANSSDFFKKLLMSFYSESMAKRERIIFKNTYDELFNHCKNQQPLLISLKTDNGKSSHTIIPYALKENKNNTYNYLLCAEKVDNADWIIRSYHLFNIEEDSVATVNSDFTLSKTCIDALEKTIQYGPQYAINTTDKAVISLTENGKELFKRIYNDRPKPLAPTKDQPDSVLNFDCSLDQLYFYFRRFGPDAKVIEPQSLKDRLITFYQESLDNYKE